MDVDELKKVFLVGFFLLTQGFLSNYGALAVTQ